MNRNKEHNIAGLRSLKGTVTLGVAGAVSSFDFPGGVVTAVTKGTGTLVFTLAKSYPGVYGFSFEIEKATDAGIDKHQVTANTVATGSGVSPQLTVTFYDCASPPVATSPESCTLYVEIEVDTLPV